MSKVTITLELDRYICTELSEVREMIETLDFSGLRASVERIQKHANSMESAIRNYNEYMNDIKNVIDGKHKKNMFDADDDSKEEVTLTAEQKLEEIKKVLQKKYHDW